VALQIFFSSLVLDDAWDLGIWFQVVAGAAMAVALWAVLVLTLVAQPVVYLVCKEFLPQRTTLLTELTKKTTSECKCQKRPLTVWRQGPQAARVACRRSSWRKGLPPPDAAARLAPSTAVCTPSAVAGHAALA
jgi:hypothetical protein